MAPQLNQVDNDGVMAMETGRDGRGWAPATDGLGVLQSASVAPNEDVQLGIRLSLEEAARKVSSLKTSALKYLSDR